MNSQIIISSRRSLQDNIDDHKPDQLITILGEPSIHEGIDVSDVRFDGLWLKMNFVDTEDAGEDHAPTIDHVKQMIAFDKGGSMIVCCNAGICRSSGVAIGLLASRGFAPIDACSLMFNHKPSIWPNALIISFFDQILCLQKLLTKTVLNEKEYYFH